MSLKSEPARSQIMKFLIRGGVYLLERKLMDGHSMRQASL